MSQEHGFRLLVTGASGLLGSNLVRLASSRCFEGQNYQVTAGLHCKQPAASLNFETVSADLCQPDAIERVFDLVQPDAVIHCVAMTDVDRCESNPEDAVRINTDLPGRMARVAARNRVQFLYISTDSVFDGEAGGYSEDDQPRPINVYSRTKLDGERYVADVYPEALIARVNFYGWSWQGRRSLAEWFYHNLEAGKPVQGFTDLIFCPLLVNDMAGILLDMLERQLHGLYHVVSSECMTKFDFGRLLAREFGFDENMVSPASYVSAHFKAPRSRILTLNCSRLERSLGIKMPGQVEGVSRFVDLLHLGYPEALRAMFREPDSSIEMNSAAVG